MSGVPSTSDVVAAEITQDAAARDNRTACKRKLQRIEGSLAVLDELISSGNDKGIGTNLPEALVKAEADVTQRHEELAALLEQTDNGDFLRGPRDNWYVAAGVCEFVRAHDLLRQYLPAVQKEAAEARERWESTQGEKKRLAEAKKAFAKVQGRFYALLEIGFRLPAIADIEEQRNRWQDEKRETDKALHSLDKAIRSRKERQEAFHREQGWRQGAERFGAQIGLTEDALMAVRLQTLEAQLTMLRIKSKATLGLRADAKAAHENAMSELNAATGRIGFLTQLREQVCTAEQLGAEEYEASLEVEVLKGTLKSLAPRAAEAMHLRLAWHSKAGARSAGEKLNAPNLNDLDAALNDAKRMADAAEPLRREEGVLRAKLAKLQGKLQALAELRTLALGGVEGQSIRQVAEKHLREVRLMHLRHSMTAADLRLIMMAHDKAQANLHAASGALVCLKKLEMARKSGAGKSAAEVIANKSTAATRAAAAAYTAGAFGSVPADSITPGLTGDAEEAEDYAAGSRSPFDPETGRLTNEMRDFVRGTFNPMLRAGMTQLLLKRPNDPYAFLADFFWQHSSLNKYPDEGAGLTQRDVDVRRKAVAAAKDDLALLTKDLGQMLDPPEQMVGASAMLDHVLNALPTREIFFNHLGDLFNNPDETAAWSIEHVDPQIRFNNGQLLDGVASVLSFYPKTLLQVHCLIPSKVSRLPPALKKLYQPEGTTEDEGVHHACRRLAKKRAEEIRDELIKRSKDPKIGIRIVATAPGADLSLQPAGMFTMHVLTGWSLVKAQSTGALDVKDELKPQRRLGHQLSADDGDLLAAQPKAMGYMPLGVTSTSNEPLSYEEEALLDLRARREEALEATLTEFQDLQAYVSQYRQMQLQEPLTLVISVIEVSLPLAAQSHVLIAFGTERIVDRVAAFEVHDASIDEVDIELWGGAEADVGGTLTKLVGNCVIGVAELLHFETPTLTAALPISGDGGIVTGNVKVTAEVRKANDAYLVPRY